MIEASSARPPLQVYQSLWAMQPHSPDGIKLPLAEVCDMVAGEGFSGLAIDLGAADIKTAYDVRPHLDRNKLTPLIVAFPKSVPSLYDTLMMAKDFGAPFVDVIGQVFPLSVEGGIPVIRKWIEMSELVGMPVQFETHRNCITNDLFYTLQLLDAVPEMRLCCDLSHYVVDREFWYPVSADNQALIQRCIERSDSFQGRVASRQQIQLQINFPQHQKWVKVFEDWWRRGFDSWLKRNPHGSPIFLCELGPPEYAMTGADGKELSNRWDEARQLRDTAHRIWAEACEAQGQPVA
jgi:hypothetical protein